MSDYIKLVTAPRLSYNYPDCGTCRVPVDYDGDQLVCPVCGTCWETSAGDKEEGSLYEEWSGEALDGPVRNEEEARQEGRRQEVEARRKLMAEIDARIAARKAAEPAQ